MRDEAIYGEIRIHSCDKGAKKSPKSRVISFACGDFFI